MCARRVKRSVRALAVRLGLRRERAWDGGPVKGAAKRLMDSLYPPE